MSGPPMRLNGPLIGCTHGSKRSRNRTPPPGTQTRVRGSSNQILSLSPVKDHFGDLFQRTPGRGRSRFHELDRSLDGAVGVHRDDARRLVDTSRHPLLLEGCAGAAVTGLAPDRSGTVGHPAALISRGSRAQTGADRDVASSRRDAPRGGPSHSFEGYSLIGSIGIVRNIPAERRPAPDPGGDRDDRVPVLPARRYRY